jgi:hypothetical protein
MEDNKEKKVYFDLDKLTKKIHNRIAVWHNNDDGLSPTEMSRELKWLIPIIIEDVLKGVHGDEARIKNDSVDIEK